MPLPFSVPDKMPHTRGRQTQRVSPVDDPSANSTASSTSSSLAVEVSALTTTALRTRLRERNLPTSGNKAALIEHLQQSASPDQPGTHHQQSTDSAAQQTRPADNMDNSPHNNSTASNNPSAATIDSTRELINVPTNLLAQLTTYLQ